MHYYNTIICICYFLSREQNSDRSILLFHVALGPAIL